MPYFVLSIDNITITPKDINSANLHKLCSVTLTVVLKELSIICDRRQMCSNQYVIIYYKRIVYILSSNTNQSLWISINNLDIVLLAEDKTNKG